MMLTSAYTEDILDVHSFACVGRRHTYGRAARGAQRGTSYLRRRVSGVHTRANNIGTFSMHAYHVTRCLQAHTRRTLVVCIRLQALAVAILLDVLREVLGVDLHTCGGVCRACIHIQTI